MSETNETADKPTQGRKPLSLQRTVESGHVQQKFGQGRSKSVVVEKKRKRVVTAPQGDAPGAANNAARGRSRSGGSGSGAAGGLSRDEMAARAAALAASHLRAAEDERLADQRKAEEAAQAIIRAQEEALKAAEAKKQTAAAAAREAAGEAPTTRDKELKAALAASTAASEPAQSVEEAAPSLPSSATADAGQAPAAPVQVEAKAPESVPGAAPGAAPNQRTARGETRPRSGATPPPAPRQPSAAERASAQEPIMKPVGMTRPMIVTRADRPNPKPPEVTKVDVDGTRRPLRSAPAAAPAMRDDDERGDKRKVGGKAARPGVREEGRVRGKLTIANAFDERQRERSLASLKRKREREKLKAMGISAVREKIIREVIIPEAITIQDLANRMTERAVDVIKYLMKQDVMHKINDVIDADTAELIVTEFGHTPKRVSEADVEDGFISADAGDDDRLEARAPVVTIMGHVDHGKTSLLDAIREAKVASGEAGGITQHIGAYQVETAAGARITFIDTPGHEAFTAMRARGAKVTDLVILVVAADDGVMPQTIEAISHAKAAGVPMIVAINKIDKPGVDPNRVRMELLQHEVVVESMSGETLDVEVSALKRINLDGLLEAIQLQAELLDLRANPDRSAEGFVIEAKLERGRGPVGTLLVQRGTLHVGDIVVAGSSWGRVRALIDEHGDNTYEAGPSTPVEVLGFDSAPEAGDQFAVVENESRAREITAYRVRKRRETLGSAGTARTLEQMMQQLHEAGQKEFPLVIKGDVQGSIEAISGALAKISTDEVQARIIHSGVGGITESDISLAVASNAIAIGFNVRANTQAKAAADRDGVEIRYYNIIYDLVDDVKSAMSGMLDPTLREVFLGNAQILEVFNISKTGKVAGCRISDGKVERGAKVRLIRENVVIHEGTLSTLKRFKDEVKEVPAGQECGMAFSNYEDMRAGDVIECFQVEVIQRTLDD